MDLKEVLERLIEIQERIDVLIGDVQVSDGSECLICGNVGLVEIQVNEFQCGECGSVQRKNV